MAGRSRMMSAREVVGKRIVGFEPNPYPNGRGGTAHDPVIILNDGSRLRFTVEEVEPDGYGVYVSRHRAVK